MLSCRAYASVDLGRVHSKTNFYRVLRLESENVGFSEIKKAYRSMALLYHPDICPPAKRDEYTTKFVELHRAYETLSDPASRRKHDLELRMCELGRDEIVSVFCREKWEVQLCELRRRSERRERERRQQEFNGADLNPG